MDCKCIEREGQNCIELVPIFSNLTKEEMFEIAKITSEKALDKGEMIYMAGSEHESLYVVHRGRIKISRINQAGKEQVIRVLGPGEFMGELSLFTKELTKDNAIALEKTIMCKIDSQDIKEIMARTPSIAVKVLEELSKRLQSTESLVEDISLSSVEKRIAKSILEDAKGDILDLKFSKGDWASYLGMSQESLSRKLSAFQDSGMIKLEGHKKIHILSRKELEEIE